MKINKLNSRGFSHHVALVLFIVIFAVSGVGYLVASHANPITNGAAAGATGCTVNQVPANAGSTQHSQISPNIAVTNGGSTSFYANFAFKVTEVSLDGSRKDVPPSGNYRTTTIRPGATTYVSAGSYKLPAAQQNLQSVVFAASKAADQYSPAFQCSATMTVQSPVATPTPAPTSASAPSNPVTTSTSAPAASSKTTSVASTSGNTASSASATADSEGSDNPDTTISNFSPSESDSQKSKSDAVALVSAPKKSFWCHFFFISWAIKSCHQ